MDGLRSERRREHSAMLKQIIEDGYGVDRGELNYICRINQPARFHSPTSLPSFEVFLSRLTSPTKNSQIWVEVYVPTFTCFAR